MSAIDNCCAVVSTVYLVVDDGDLLVMRFRSVVLAQPLSDVGLLSLIFALLV